MPSTVSVIDDLSVEPIERYSLASDESSALHAWSVGAARAIPGELGPDDLTRLAVSAHEVPRSLRERLVHFRHAGTGGLVVSGLPLDETLLGPTPADLRGSGLSEEVRRADLVLLLLASLLGDPFAHAGVQDGRLVLDILPVAGNENTQLGSSSTGTLHWHTEDAYDDFRADWFILMCLRNPLGVATTFARANDALKRTSVKSIHFKKRFRLKPDSSHAVTDADENAGGPKWVALLSGDPAAPFIRMDPAFMDTVDPESDAAREELEKAFDAVLQDVVLQPGEMLIVDNMRAIHGRQAFEARFDGTDRWLRLVNLTADLRKSAGRRVAGGHGRALVGLDA